jgi:hypothetical protein
MDGRNATRAKPGVLRQTLGAWLPDSTPTQSPRWDTFLEHSSQRLFVPIKNEPQTFYQLSTQNRLDFNLANYDTQGTKRWISRVNLPKEAVPVQPSANGSIQRVNRPQTPTKLPQTVPTRPTTFREHMDHLPIWKAGLLAGTFTSHQIDTFREYLLHAHPLLMCSDGGAKGNTGSFGWVIATPKKAIWESIGTATG